MLTAVVAVAGTLTGSLLTGVLQHFVQRAQRVSAEASARRMEGLDAVAALASALADHQRAMSVREEIRLAGGDWSAARTESHLTRSAITGPLLRVQLLLPVSPRPRRAPPRPRTGCARQARRPSSRRRASTRSRPPTPWWAPQQSRSPLSRHTSARTGTPCPWWAGPRFAVCR